MELRVKVTSPKRSDRVREEEGSLSSNHRSQIEHEISQHRGDDGTLMSNFACACSIGKIELINDFFFSPDEIESVVREISLSAFKHASMVDFSRQNTHAIYVYRYTSPLFYSLTRTHTRFGSFRRYRQLGHLSLRRRHEHTHRTNLPPSLPLSFSHMKHSHAFAFSLPLLCHSFLSCMNLKL